MYKSAEIGSDSVVYHLSLLISLVISTSKGISVESCEHSNLTPFLNISHMKPLYIQKHFTVCFGRPNYSLSFTAFSNTKSLSALPQVVCQDELDKPLVLPNVVVSQDKLWQS